jgi:predicted RNA-binding Zn-ribbon protein involved in translation (DUF1610 family)
MQEGRLAIERSRLDAGMLESRAMRSVPLSALRFEPAVGPTVTPRLSGTAWMCPSCDLIVLEGFGSLSCFECGETISADAEACPKCGWSWK